MARTRLSGWRSLGRPTSRATGSSGPVRCRRRIYRAEYEPPGHGYSNGKIIAGDTGGLKPIDRTPAGGRSLALDVSPHQNEHGL
jgi:hypothetical protein